MAVHLLAGGAGDDLPDKWHEATDSLGPPGPAAEFAHCPAGLRQSRAGLPDAGSTEARWMQFHTTMAMHHNFGISGTSYSATGSSLKVSEWTIQAMAAAPCLGHLLHAVPRTLSTVVCYHQPPHACSCPAVVWSRTHAWVGVPRLFPGISDPSGGLEGTPQMCDVVCRNWTVRWVSRPPPPRHPHLRAFLLKRRSLQRCLNSRMKRCARMDMIRSRKSHRGHVQVQCIEPRATALMLRSCGQSSVRTFQFA